ncbi:hypothetical protein LU680_17855 [Pseudomonas monteilii]|nr:hypothetical protein [Pseudomonas monteilii]MCE0877049.1 hypothetical protein [Pseudomonas monteilii]WJN86117.1 hypothetical protein LU680_17855 [Pseudomonas monteilii]WJO30779.1 hypothetical protein LU690_16920 [Pseudomonas monteilii]WJR48272.1 hypothetical protein LU655_016500 [Pseudomonas monteilii]
MTNMMREQFEAWTESAFIEVDLTKGNHGSYAVSGTHWLYCAWVAGWKESRDAVVVKMPDRASKAYQEHFDDVEGGCFNEAAYIHDVRMAIEAQGLKVAP